MAFKIGTTTVIDDNTAGSLTSLAVTNAITAGSFSGRRTQRVSILATNISSFNPDVSQFDIYVINGLTSGSLTFGSPTGNPVDGDRLIFRILDNGTTKTLSWNATFTPIGVALPSSTTASKTTYVGCIYNANNTRWDVIAASTQL
jgi:hypothetical protein